MGFTLAPFSKLRKTGSENVESLFWDEENPKGDAYVCAAAWISNHAASAMPYGAFRQVLRTKTRILLRKYIDYGAHRREDHRNVFSSTYL